jgi:hypothetical protein
MGGSSSLPCSTPARPVAIALATPSFAFKMGLERPVPRGGWVLPSAHPGGHRLVWMWALGVSSGRGWRRPAMRRIELNGG